MSIRRFTTKHKERLDITTVLLYYNAVMKEKEPRFGLSDLCSLTGLTRRTIRYYIQLGLADRPEGSRRGAFYTRRHLERLMAIQAWRKAGLSLDRIRELLEAGEKPGPVPRLRKREPGTVEVWSHLVLGEGLELIVEPRQAGLDPEQLRRLLRDVRKAADRVRGKRAARRSRE